ncbi:transcription factor SPT20 homolog isoform X2 [Daphnia pulex]|uniref:transcription factor SPT20 homolog isoform X2 n=1 Tax=Daphnia pulex TaxID=6669 RepID=UPI001EDD9A8F|nr:transcription factor SPT20 homolog isoform X2 [Daphnia pulex]
MKLSLVSALFVATAVLSVSAERNERQLFSSSRFSSSGLVFPGPPATQAHPPKQQLQQRAGIQQRQAELPAGAGNQQASEKSDASGFVPSSRQQLPQAQRFQQGPNFANRPGNGPRPPFVPGSQQERTLPPVPLSLIGQQPEEFIAAAQQRQQLQQQQQQQQAQQARQQQPQQQPQQRPQIKPEEENEELLTSAEIQREFPEEFVPRAPVRPQPQPQPQQRENPEKPIRIRPRPQQDERAEPSIPQPTQQRRPNYPSDYKPQGRPQQNNGLDDERRRPQPNQAAEAEDELLDEEEEVKPDKLQLLLQKTDFSCVERKDGYYADEAVECEIFHYCQDKTRHSWLCPAGASFHQVHLICMPVAKDNICKKSSQFHFVNDYLYQPMQDEDGNNSTLYADRYYPDGYLPGDDMADVVEPEKPNLQYNNRRQQAPAQNNRSQQRYNPDRPNRERVPINENRRGIEPRRPAFQAPSADEDSAYNKSRGEDSPNRRVASRPQMEAAEDEEEEQ